MSTLDSSGGGTDSWLRARIDTRSSASVSNDRSSAVVATQRPPSTASTSSQYVSVIPELYRLFNLVYTKWSRSEPVNQDGVETLVSMHCSEDDFLKLTGSRVS